MPGSILGTRDTKGQNKQTNKNKRIKNKTKNHSPYAGESYRLMKEKGKYIIRIG